MNYNLAQQAINLALAGKWEDAVKANLNLLKDYPDNTESLNRLARAYTELGKIDLAKKTAQKVLKIDPFNTIAKKTLDKLKGLKEGEISISGSSSAQEFLEEPGKTKIVGLLNIANNKALAKIDSGDEVYLNTNPHKVSVNTKDGSYIGKLPDDISAHIKKLIRMGNEYKSLIKSVNDDGVKIFIREIKKSPKVGNTPSFTTEKIEYISFTPPELVHNKKDIEEQVQNDDEDND